MPTERPRTGIGQCRPLAIRQQGALGGRAVRSRRLRHIGVNGCAAGSTGLFELGLAVSDRITLSGTSGTTG